MGVWLKRLTSYGLPAVLLLAAGPARADAMFSDGTFAPADYVATPSFTSGGAAITAGQCASCGNPGTAQQIQITFPGTGDADIGFINTLFAYDPHTQGKIGSISASVDKDITVDFTIDPSEPFGNSFHPTIEQDGNYYLATIAGPSFTSFTTGYNTIAQGGLVAGDFQEYDFTTESFVAGNPDFGGDPMLFGLTQITGVVLTGPGDFEADYDNLSFDVSVPEPSSLLLLGGLLLAFAAIIPAAQKRRG